MSGPIHLLIEVFYLHLSVLYYSTHVQFIYQSDILVLGLLMERSLGKLVQPHL